MGLGELVRQLESPSCEFLHLKFFPARERSNKAENVNVIRLNNFRGRSCRTKNKKGKGKGVGRFLLEFMYPAQMENIYPHTLTQKKGKFVMMKEYFYSGMFFENAMK